MIDKYDYAGQYTADNEVDALCRALRATAMIAGEISAYRLAGRFSAAEAELAIDAESALGRARFKLWRLQGCVNPAPKIGGSR